MILFVAVALYLFTRNRMGPWSGACKILFHASCVSV